MKAQFDPPADWTRIETIDAHTAGEPLRVVTAGWPDIPGDTILAKRKFARENHDDLRRALMWEPRGHADMYGCILTEPVTPDGDVGVLFLHNEGYSTMCGHGIIGLVKVGLECGLLNPERLERDKAGRPIGTGVSGRAAIHHLRGELAPGETITIESIIGSTFDVSVAGQTTVGALPAIVPEVTGSAYITGRHEFFIDPGDPLGDGFFLR